ncbi:MAG: hypothetical protein HEQ23_10510 [Tepidisphaera sp.]
MAAAGAAMGQPIASESFEYSPPGLLLPQYVPGGSGWASPWDGNWQVGAGSLRYSSNGLEVAARGNKVVSNSAISQRTMNVAPLGEPGTSVWVSMLAKQTAGASANTFAGLRLPTGPTTFLYMGKPYGLPNWGIDGGPGTTKRQSTVPATEQSLLVMRVDFRAGADDVYLWVNPPLTAEAPSTETADIRAIGYNNFDNIPKVLMEMGAVGSTITAEIDEVTVARDWSNAVMMEENPSLCVTPRSVGGCCYEFDLGQKSGGGFPGVVMTLPPGTTVSSATIGTMPAGSTVTYTPGGTTVQWELPSGTRMNSATQCLFNFTVSVCFSSVTSGVTTALFDALGGSGFGFQSHVLNGPTCGSLPSGCCDTWKQESAAAIQPTASSDSAMVYDLANQVTVLWGGADCNGAELNELWLRKNYTWVRATPVTPQPAARFGHAMAYDPVRGVIVMYGGADQFGTLYDDLWELRFNGSDWVWNLRCTGCAAGPLWQHAMAYDSISKKVIIAGGQQNLAGGCQSTNACFSWNGSSLAAEASMPFSRHSHAMALDESRNTIVMYGGVGSTFCGPGPCGYSTEDIAEYSNGVWTHVTSVLAPSGADLYEHAMVYDSACGRILIVGGKRVFCGTAGVLTNTMWSYDGLTFNNATPPVMPSQRWAHSMSWDRKEQRVVLNGGVGATGCLRETHHFDSFYASYQIGGGYGDSFGSVYVEPAPALAPEFLRLRPLLATAVFDQTVSNKVFGTSFSIPGGARTKITKAVLEFRAMPLSGGASNDTFGISDFTRTGGGLWSVSFANLPASGGSWNAGHAATTFLLDLSALPIYTAGGLQSGTYNMIADLNTAGSWPDLFVQDDTAVDYARLYLWTCPRRPVWAGFGFSEFGAASANVNAMNRLEMTGTGQSGGGGGVEFDVGSGSGADLHWATSPFASSPVGSTVEIVASGVVSDVPESMISRIVATKTSSNQVAFTCDAGRPTNRVELFNGSTMVASVSGVPTGQPCFMIGNNWHTDWHCNDPANLFFVWSSVTWNDPEQALLQGTLFPSVTEVRFTPEGPVNPVTGVQSVRFAASGVDLVEFDELLVWSMGAQFQGGEGSRIHAEASSVLVTKHDTVKNTIQNVRFADAEFVELEFIPFDENGDLDLLGSDWGIMLASFTASGGDLPPGTSPSVTYRSDTGVPPDGQGTWIAQEFTVPPGIACVAYNGPTVVATFTPAQAASVRVNRLPGRAGWMPTSSGGHGLFNGFPTGTKLHAPGLGLIDITSLVWDGGAASPASISEITIEAGELTDSFTITGVSFAVPCAADFNQDGFVDFFDYDGFVGAFESGTPDADFNADGFIDFFDYDAFVGAFETGC